MGEISVAVVTGGHSYDVREFRDFFSTLSGIKAYVQHIDDFCSSPEDVRDGYDAVVLYFMPDGEPSDEMPGFAGKQRSALSHLMSGTGQGIVVLHHAIVAYQSWNEWAKFVDISDRSLEFDHDQTVNVHVNDTDHPITRGLSDFVIVDETYLMNGPGSLSHVLLTTDHPRSMTEIAWVRTVGQSNVFYFQLGHDAIAWVNDGFRAVLSQGIAWAAKAL